MGEVGLNTGATVQAQGILYKAVVQLVLIYRSESWGVTGAMLKVIEGFHHRAERRITGMTEQRTTAGIVIAPSLQKHWRSMYYGQSRSIYSGGRIL